MGIRKFTKIIKTTSVISVLCYINIAAHAQSPYALFGDKSVMLEARDEPINNIYCIQIQNSNGDTYFVDFNWKKGVVSLSVGNIIIQDCISEYAKAMFTMVDPHAENYYCFNPYNFCGGDGVNAIDTDGKDWYRNNDTSYYTWFYGDEEKEGYTRIGRAGSLLGEFESKINSILVDVYKIEYGLYSEGRTIDITDPDKGAIIPTNIFEFPMANFVNEFVYGYGPEISILNENHPYTNVLKTDERVLESQQNLQSGNTVVPGQITRVGRSWGLFDYFTTLSMAKQFVGSYTFDSYTSKDKNHLLNIIYDTKNFRSLVYHIPGSGYLNHSRNSIIKPFSTTYQFYIWKSKK